MSGFLPISASDMRDRGWKELDVILVTGDAYVDHPSYGAAVIGRVLEDAGYKVGVIAQPDWRSADDFRRLGRPRLFFGVTAGNIDSMVANYTANKIPRKEDDYSPGGRSGMRPDRPSIVYTNRIREAFDRVPVVLGGLEAGMRRLAHYDYWSDSVRRSILLDSKADMLVYGMGERQVLEIARRLDKGDDIDSLSDIRGTVVVRNSTDGFKDCVTIPSLEEVSSDKDKFNISHNMIYAEADPVRGRPIAQACGARYAIQLPPAMPFTPPELDRIYDLPYTREYHPSYEARGGIPGLEPVRFSIISHRGCPGACNFCSIYLHQGRIVQSRSIESIVKEVRLIAARTGFRGTITDIGGPTANLYGAACESWSKTGACAGKLCLVPGKCEKLDPGYRQTLKLWREIRRIKEVKYLFVGSGVRYDLLTEDYSNAYMRDLCESHISGQLKVAPEHSDRTVLRLMNKPDFEVYEKFTKRFRSFNERLGKRQFLVNYIICGHPGSRLEDTLKLALYLEKKHIHPEQVQDFIPLPMTISGCMYYTEKDPATGEAIYVAKGLKERRMQRALLQHDNPRNKKYVLEALKELNVLHLSGKFLHYGAKTRPNR